jgi:L-alanine-DL-glutamate epimerase-like enolase superfamily enzyme
MKITHVEPFTIRIPLRHPVAISGVTFSDREYNLVRIDTDQGVSGFGYARGGALVHEAVARALAPLILGSDPFGIEVLWQAMWEATVLIGRRGAVLRAISMVDIALWDLKAKVLELPLYRLLGGSKGEVPAYVSAAYYRQGDSPEAVAEEVVGCVERGFRAVKMRVGGRPLGDDIARVQAVRRAIGNDIDLMVDANFGYNDHVLGLRAGRAFQEQGVKWLEEPTEPDNLLGSAQIAAALDMAIATGESEGSRFGFRDIIAKGAADILQPDATVVGGVSEWMKVAALASAHHLRIAPHYFWEVHAHLVAATPAAFTVEYFERESDLVNFDDVLKEPFRPVNGLLRLPERPGIGWVIDEDAISRFRIQ